MLNPDGDSTKRFRDAQVLPPACHQFFELARLFWSEHASASVFNPPSSCCVDCLFVALIATLSTTAFAADTHVWWEGKRCQEIERLQHQALV